MPEPSSRVPPPIELTIAHTGDSPQGAAAMAEDMIRNVSVISSSR